MNEQLQPADEADKAPPKPLNAIQRRILGVLIEKARTTPDVYPLSLNGLVTGANQKSNRHPLMQLTPERIEDELIEMRGNGVVAEVQGGSRVPKYRHYGYDYLGVKGMEAAVMTELLLRGEQTVGELRTRAGRFEPIPDLQTLQTLLAGLESRGLVVFLTPPGRGQLVTHNLYFPEELAQIKRQSQLAAGSTSAPSPQPASVSATSTPAAAAPTFDPDELNNLREEVCELRLLVEQLVDRVQRLES